MNRIVGHSVTSAEVMASRVVCLPVVVSNYRRILSTYDIQGVPKDRSSDFMHYNFWSKLYFYMKLLEDVYFSIKYMYSEFQ